MDKDLAGNFYKHKASGVRYYVSLLTNIDCINPSFIPTVVYFPADGSDFFYSRPVDEFIDKFELETSCINP